MFKIGDKVIITKGKSNSSAILDGQVAIITVVSKSWCNVDKEKGTKACSGLWNSELRKVGTGLEETIRKAAQLMRNCDV